ncbi:MAG: globin [Gammaproteobacteria bacterium]|jgi:hemoglobin-like flavoprotein|nr:globin [Gammaproteobacteria bacterium]MBT4494689.1 globin [Gammaproteobacteria bacterium]MBT7371976.1 globin [Gammaproteobacteria bacterium]
MSDDLIIRSLELAVANAGDITPAVYKKYFARCQDSKALMIHVDELVRGKMMDEVYRLVMVEDYGEEDGYLNWEVDNHEMAYSVKPHMYESLFSALIETICESLGDEWNADYAAAWKQRSDRLRHEIVRRFSEAV